MTQPDFAKAEQFVSTHARVLDRRRFQRAFEGGAAQPVRDAVAAYRNEDGGFGNAIEPDCRAPGSQPASVEIALRTLDESDAWDEALATAACDWLQTVAPAEGGAAFVLPGLERWARAPWWAPEDGLPPSLITTARIAGTLVARGVRHPWLDRAVELVWERIGRIDEAGPYDLYGVLGFLDRVPDRVRAEAALDTVGPALLRVVELDPDAPGEVHGPLGFAPRPDSIARSVFDAATIERHLDHLAAAQRGDGGWTFNWPAWLPAAELDWRGSITVDALVTLRANGRL